MTQILHIVTRPVDDLSRQVIDQQREQADITVREANLAESGIEVDYRDLLNEIFAADSVQVW